ncbi:MAG: heavy-metal-associated domain-containing protein [Sporichthyaceae bacterium]
MSSFVLAIEGMHCASCGMLIDDAVEDLAGVQRSSTDMRAKRTTVELDGTGATPTEVIGAIEAEGYRAVLVAP